jgi:hypothetical protein
MPTTVLELTSIYPYVFDSSHCLRLGLSKTEHVNTAICYSSQQVNIGQLLINPWEILTFSTRHGIDGCRSLRRASSCEPDNIERPHHNRREGESENVMEKQ